MPTTVTFGRSKRGANRLQAEISSANTLVRHLVALLDHYVAAYQETRDILAQRDRELAEERRSRGSMPTPLRR